ncbi:hypothetical protein M3N64_12805 [Sporolactobacillus sp. CPB3-1]|uniref:DUF3797 domain-containing protein n=1 Tax=Sporolactobacillus mangiferae TaxID=2940498 RepID=A0ABT0MD57_9BACL|nr:hypothetical protein [Sporolactobacillus mangiferae]MCL1632801.1 hypothetical protein [Sporolactobacillus mangiferae]
MQLKVINEESHVVGAAGGNWGDTTNIVYECPCGKGKVYYEHDDIPGYRNRNISCDCDDCNQKYDFGKGMATPKK